MFKRKKKQIPRSTQFHCNMGEGGSLNLYDEVNKCFVAKNVQRGNVYDTIKSYRTKLLKENNK